MGTDVESTIEVRASTISEQDRINFVDINQLGDDKWVMLPDNPWDENRDYFLFAVLAGVRNGYGFGGAPRHVPVTPITEDRGLPENHPWNDDPCNRYNHSQTWVLGSELMAWFNGTVHEVQESGVLTMDEFKKWDGKQPDSYYTFICGRDTKVAVDETSYVRVFGTNLNDELLAQKITDSATHVRVFWVEHAQSKVLRFFEDVVKPLMTKYGEFRLTMRFDS
jgi:hypothetical protein